MKRDTVKKKFNILLVVLLAIPILSACQKAPGDSLVIGNNTAKLLKMAMVSQNIQGSISEALSIKSNGYKTYFEDESGNIKVNVDADVVLPDADNIPIVRVITKYFSQDTVNKLIDVLFKEGTLYDPESITEFTKSDIQKLLVLFEQKKAQLEDQGMKPTEAVLGESEAYTSSNESSSKDDKFSTSTENMNELDQVIKNIALYKQMLETAPDKKNYKEVSRELHSQDISGMSKENQAKYKGKLFEVAHVGQLNENGGMSSLFVVNNDVSNTSLVQFINRKDYDLASGMYYTEEQWNQTVGDSDKEKVDDLAYPTITEEEAVRLANQLLDQIGIDYMNCASVEKVIGGSSSEFAGGIKIGNLLKAYRLQYVREIDAVPVTYTNVRSSWNYSDTNEIFTWDYEKMTLIIDEGGIVEMLWESPYEIIETVTKNTAMLPFSEIQDIFKKMIIVDNADYSEYGMDLNISEIRLGLACITEQNDLKSGLLIPVWDFFGTATYHYGDGETETYTVNDSGESYLTINAIDGSIIERQRGY